MLAMALLLVFRWKISWRVRFLFGRKVTRYGRRDLWEWKSFGRWRKVIRRRWSSMLPPLGVAMQFLLLGSLQIMWMRHVELTALRKRRYGAMFGVSSA